MEIALLLLLFAPPPSPDPADALISAIARSGQVVESGDTRERIAPPKRLAPGAPPLLAFRYFSGADKHRFGNLDVMLDDAGH